MAAGRARSAAATAQLSSQGRSPPARRASAQSTAASLLAFDHRLAAQFAKIVLGLGLELIAEHFLAHFALLGGFGLGFLFFAQREQLDALRRRFRRSQAPDLGLVDN